MSHRVLLFVEPYVVRSGPGDFATPARLFGVIAAQLNLMGIRSAVICNSAMAKQGVPGVEYLTPSRYGLDEAMSPQWQENWVAMLKGRDVDGWGDYYRRALEEFDPTLVYLWNKNGLFQKLAVERGVGVVNWEYGGVRTPGGFRIAVDPAGFGPESALATEPFTTTDDDAAAGWSWAADHILRDCIGMHLPRRVGFIPPGDNGGINPTLHLAVLLQKEDDVNFLIWPSFPSIWDFVQQTLRELTATGDLAVTVRPHPAGLEDYRPRIAAAFPSVVVDDGGRNFYQALLDYDAVITLNSAGGFEALMCGKPVLSMSAGFYDCSMVGADAGDRVRSFLDTVRQGTYWSAQRRRHAGAFLWRMVSQYSVPQEMLTQPSLHRAIVAELSGKSPADVSAWFSARPANLARLASAHRDAASARELASLRIENHERAAAIQTLSRQRDALEAELAAIKQEVSRHRSGLDDMTRDNLRRDADIAELSKPIMQRVREKLGKGTQPRRHEGR